MSIHNVDTIDSGCITLSLCAKSGQPWHQIHRFPAYVTASIRINRRVTLHNHRYTEVSRKQAIRPRPLASTYVNLAPTAIRSHRFTKPRLQNGANLRHYTSICDSSGHSTWTDTIDLDCKDFHEPHINSPRIFSMNRKFCHNCFPATVSQVGLTLSVQVNLKGMMQKARSTSRSNSKLIWTLLSCHERKIKCAIAPLHRSCPQKGLRLIAHVMLIRKAWKILSLGARPE